MNALRSFTAPAALALAALACAPVAAGTIWDGGGVNDNWTTSANWNAIGLVQSPPANNGTADVHLAGAMRRTPIVNAPYSINSLTFDNGAAAFVLLGAQQLTIGAGGVRSNDADMQTVIGPIRLAADQTWTSAAGRLQMDQVNLNGFDLTFGGAGLIDLIGVIHGAGDLILPRRYTSTVTMVGVNNSYLGATTVLGGTLALLGSGVAVPGDLTIGPGTVRLAGNEKISQAAGVDVTVHGGGLLDVSTYTETLADLLVTGGGRVKVGAGGKLTFNEAVVTGPGSTLEGGYQSSLYVGEVGGGALNILDRGKVTSALAYVGFGSGSTGVVAVDGVESTWDVTSSYIGYNGSGVVNITGGGTVTGRGGSMGVGASSTGVVNVDGANSLWDMAYNSSLTLGYQGAASVNVTRGGHVNSGEYTIIGYMPGSFGSISVDGLNSKWYSPGYIELGGGDGGALSVTDQGSVASALPIYVRSRGELRGNGVIDADVENGGLVAPGPSTGALSINGYYTQKPEGVLEIELGGANDYDQLFGNPNTYIASLDGTLEVKLVGGFTPLVGQTFTIVSAYDVDGQFADVLLPSVPGRRFDVIYNPQSVVLRVALNLGGGAAASSVPEPGALALALMVGSGLAMFRPRRR